MDIGKLSAGERIAAVSAIALLVVMFLSWYRIEGATLSVGGSVQRFSASELEAEGFDTSLSAWQAFDVIDVVLLVTAIAGIGAGLLAVGETRPEVPFSPAAVTAGLGALSVLLILFRIVEVPDVAGSLPSLGQASELAKVQVHAGRGPGPFLGLVAAGGVALGGWLSTRDSRARR